LTILLPTEIQLINEMNNTYADYGDIGCIHWDIIRRAQEHPQKIALVLENGTISYGELLFYVQHLASHLIITYTIQSGEVICQLVERSFEMVIGMIAILMCGAIYTGLSSREPLSRLLTCIKQTTARLVLIHHATQHISLTECSLVDINHIISLAEVENDNFSVFDIVNATPDHIAYIVFTSGSTGIPKGVCKQGKYFIKRRYLTELLKFLDVV
jgi:non-ribosomal peptide synthetase component F